MPKFAIGDLVATANALATFTTESLQGCLNRHANCDWGDLCEEDKACNEIALECGGRLLSSYLLPNRRKLWVITEGDRSATTLLLPEDY